MIFLFSLFVFFGPIIYAILPKVFSNINVIWGLFFAIAFIFPLYQIRNKQNISIFNLWMGILIIFCSIEILSVSWSDYYSYDNEIIMHLFARYISPVVIAFIALNLLATKRNYHKAIKYLTIASVFISIFTLFQMIYGFQTLFSPGNTFETYRASGTFQNANGLAIYLVLAIPHLLYGINNEIISRKAGWCSIAIILIGIICTVSRKGIITAWLCMILFFMLNKDIKKLTSFAIATIIAIMILSGYVFISQRFAPNKVENEFAGKHAMAMAGLDMFYKNPLLGAGYQGYSENYNKYFRRSYLTEPLKFDSHNIFITVLANYGLLGFFPLMAIFLYPLYISTKTLRKGSIKYSKDSSILCIATIVPFMMNGFFSGGLLDLWPVMMMFYTNVIILFSIKTSSIDYR